MFTIYTKKLALYLREQGFELMGTGVNKNFPQYNTYIFKDNEQLRAAVTEFTANKK